MLRRWLVEERCRLVGVLGVGGVGKTSLAAVLAQEVAPSFERVYWRSLRDAPPPSEWLAGAIGFLSDQQLVPAAAESERLMVLLQLLRDRRCLLVLDNAETLFEPGTYEGRYREGLAEYGHLLQMVGEARHQSCLMLTSREAPPELPILGREAVRTFELGGLGVDEVRVLLSTKRLVGTGQQWAELVARFGGNGLALKMVGESIRELLKGDIETFLEQAESGGVFGGLRRLLGEQVERSSALEQQVLRMLAVEREPLSLAALLAALGPRVGRGTVLEAVEALRRRSLVERAETPGVAAFTLQSVVLEYITDRLVDAAAEDIERGRPVLLIEQPLIKAQAKELRAPDAGAADRHTDRAAIEGEPWRRRNERETVGPAGRLAGQTGGRAGLCTRQPGQFAAAAAGRLAPTGLLPSGVATGLPGASGCPGCQPRGCPSGRQRSG
jgi:hypothetical protein